MLWPEIIALACLGAAPASAQSLPLLQQPEGRFALGYTDRVPGADAFLFGDATVRLESGRAGLELGVFGLDYALDTPHETYGTLTWDIGANGRIAAGVPRPAYDSFAVSEMELLFPSLGIARTAATRSLATHGAMFTGYLPYGARFQNAVGDLRYAASAHTVSNADVTIASFGASYLMGDYELSGAVEVSWGATTEVSGKVQARGAVGLVNGGIGLYLPGATGASEMLEAFASFDPFSKVTLSGVVQVPLGGSNDPSGGMSARYALRQNVGLSVGVLTDAGANAAVSAHLDWTF
jgi:hypothetical protein